MVGVKCGGLEGQGLRAAGGAGCWGSGQQLALVTALML